MSRVVQKPELRILYCLAYTAVKYRKGYCFPSQKTILHNLREKWDVHMSRRTLNRHLAGLEAQGWVQRVRRHCKNAQGNLELHSTLYKMTQRLYMHLRRFMINGFRRLWQNLGKPAGSPVPHVAQQGPFPGDIYLNTPRKPPPKGPQALAEIIQRHFPSK